MRFCRNSVRLIGPKPRLIRHGFANAKHLKNPEEIAMQERRQGPRYSVSFPIRMRWKDENGNEIVEEGLTENVGLTGTLVYLPRKLPDVGSKVNLTVTEHANDEVSVIAQVIRLERNAAHPQAALNLVEGMRLWKKKVWEYAGETIANQRPDDIDDW